MNSRGKKEEGRKKSKEGKGKRGKIYEGNMTKIYDRKMNCDEGDKKEKK